MNRDIVYDNEKLLSGNSNNKSINVYYYFDFENKMIRMSYLTNKLYSDLYATINDETIQTIKNEFFKICLTSNDDTNPGEYVITKNNNDIIIKLNDDKSASILCGSKIEYGYYYINNIASSPLMIVSFDIIISTNNSTNKYYFYVNNKVDSGCHFKKDTSTPSNYFNSMLDDGDFFVWIGNELMN